MSIVDADRCMYFALIALITCFHLFLGFSLWFYSFVILFLLLERGISPQGLNWVCVCRVCVCSHFWFWFERSEKERAQREGERSEPARTRAKRAQKERAQREDERSEKASEASPKSFQLQPAALILETPD